MTVRLRERPQRLPHAGSARSRDDHGVSPVVGMILVLAISIVGIAAILYWGLPAIDEMKANVEYRAVTGQFTELDGTIKELAAGTTEKTAKRWQPTFNRGSAGVVADSEGWLIAVEPHLASPPASRDFRWYDFDDGDPLVSITNGGASNIASWKVEAYIVTGTTSLTTLNVTLSTAGNDDQMTTQGTAWSAGTSKTFKLWVKDAAAPGTAQEVQGATFKLRVYSGSDVVAEAWYVNTGRVDYRLNGGVTQKDLIENNGAVIAGADGGYAIVNTPPIPPPTTVGGTDRLFARLISIQGTAGFGGDNRFDVLISLYSTATLASYDCALAAKTDCVDSVRIYDYGTYQDAWYAYLLNDDKGYEFTKETADGESYLVQRDAAGMAFTLLGSTITMTG